MSAIAWTPGLVLPQGDEDVLDYTFNFAFWLAGDTIADATVEGAGLNAAVQESAANTVKVRVSDATANSSMTLRVTTTSGQRADFTTFFNPQRTTCCA